MLAKIRFKEDEKHFGPLLKTDYPHRHLLMEVLTRIMGIKGYRNSLFS